MPISGKKMLKMYKKAGWIVIRQKGSHVRVSKGSVYETIPVHSTDLGKGLESKLIKKLEETE
ncbi:MAG: type II toxin-antitoxin system HicA family toxin [Spirochaetota bacterium]|nr:type II toxin-antitoxin system HicA family toxin [Spirochaetota bacterium]